MFAITFALDKKHKTMKTWIYVCALSLLSAFHLTSCAQNKSQSKQNMEMANKKILVAFFSRAGENYSVGNVKVGNTQVLAEMIAAETQADLFHIEPVNAYPADYTECTEVAKEELQKKARPAITGDANVDDYDIIFIGYPNWWGDAPMPVYTFIEQHNWQGKTVVPFCTHEGSGLSNASQIKAACKGATLLKGLGMYGHTAQNSRDEAKATARKWLQELGLTLNK